MSDSYSPVKEAIIFFPNMKLIKVHTLKNGKIGSFEDLKTEFPFLNNFKDILERSTVRSKKVENPCVAVTNNNSEYLSHEIEILSFFIVALLGYHAADEVISNRAFFEIGADFIRLNNNLETGLDELLTIEMRNEYPLRIQQYDTYGIEKFEEMLSNSILES